MHNTSWEFLTFRKIGPFTPAAQALCIAILYVCTVAFAYMEYAKTGLMFGYPLSISILFVPIYEEILFRGFILGYLRNHVSPTKAIAITSVIFALWHLKNIFFLSPGRLIYQMAYTGLIISPIFAYVTLKTKSVWPAVILHYLNNLAAPLSVLLFASLMK